MRPEPLNVVMAIDVSGSMSGQPMEDAKAAMCQFVSELDFSYARVAVLAVSDSTAIVTGLSDDEDVCMSAIRSIECGSTGYGNAAHPFNKIRDLLKDEDGRRFAIVLADSAWSYQDVAISAAKQCNALEIETAAIGFGGADSDFLKAISSDDANGILVAQAELSRAFGSIAQSLGGASAMQNELSSTSLDVATWTR